MGLPLTCKGQGNPQMAQVTADKFAFYTGKGQGEAKIMSIAC